MPGILMSSKIKSGLLAPARHLALDDGQRLISVLGDQQIAAQVLDLEQFDAEKLDIRLIVLDQKNIGQQCFFQPGAIRPWRRPSGCSDAAGAAHRRCTAMGVLGAA